MSHDTALASVLPWVKPSQGLGFLCVNSYSLYALFKFEKKKKNQWGALCYTYRDYSSSMAEQPFLNWGEREISSGPLSSPSTWSPRNIGITFTSWNFQGKWWALCKLRILRPGLVPVSPKCFNQGLCCCRRWRAREAHPEGSWTCSEFGDLERAPKAEVCPSVRNVDEWCCWSWCALVQHYEGDCAIILMCQIQAWLSKLVQTNPFGISVLLSPSGRWPAKKKG